MIRAVVEVGRGSVYCTEKVQAESIEYAVRLAAAHYPDAEIRVLFPSEPEAFSVEDSTPVLGAGLPKAPT